MLLMTVMTNHCVAIIQILNWSNFGFEISGDRYILRKKPVQARLADNYNNHGSINVNEYSIQLPINI